MHSACPVRKREGHIESVQHSRTSTAPHLTDMRTHEHSAEQAQCRTAEHSARRTCSLDPHVCTAATWITFSCGQGSTAVCGPSSLVAPSVSYCGADCGYPFSTDHGGDDESCADYTQEFVQNRTVEQQRTLSFSDPRCIPISSRKSSMRKWRDCTFLLWNKHSQQESR